MDHEVKIRKKHALNHDVVQFRLERPKGYEFVAGQAIELTVRKPTEKGPGPFTFTGLNTDEDLELTIKIYRERNGLTAALEKLNVGDTVVITDPWDSFIDRGSGVFIAGGAGITPFIALLRQMHKDGKVGESRLIFSNKTRADIFLDDELKSILGDRYVNYISYDDQRRTERYIDEAFLRQYIRDVKQPFYVCGPPGFTDSVQGILKGMGASEQMVNISL